MNSWSLVLSPPRVSCFPLCFFFYGGRVHALVLCIRSNARQQKCSRWAEAEFDEKGRFIFREYDMQKPFSSFLPGVGGEWGTPLYVRISNVLPMRDTSSCTPGSHGRVFSRYF